MRTDKHHLESAPCNGIRSLTGAGLQVVTCHRPRGRYIPPRVRLQILSWPDLTQRHHAVHEAVDDLEARVMRCEHRRHVATVACANIRAVINHHHITDFEQLHDGMGNIR